MNFDGYNNVYGSVGCFLVLTGKILKSEGYLFMFEDKILVCQDCGQEFVFTAGEQEFYHEKGFENEPKRCKDCRSNRRNNRNGNRAPREMFSAVCARCGAETQVPFKPVEGRPVYCMECFQQSKEAAY